jgi:tryptophan-rich sensory protein
MKSIDALCWWLEHTALSQTIQSVDWIVPAVQTIHILAITVVAASALMIDLRLIGVFSADRPLREVSARFLPLVWWPLLVLLATGAIMIIGEPARSLKNPAFQLKMVLLVTVLVVTALYQLLLRRDPALGSPASSRRGTATAIATLSMLLWSGIIFAGRWIAYYS